MNNILYGHQMEKHKMFGDLKNFLERSYFDTHTSGSVYYESQWHGIEFFALLCVDAYDDVVYNTGLKGNDDQERVHEETRCMLGNGAFSHRLSPTFVSIADRIATMIRMTKDIAAA